MRIATETPDYRKLATPWTPQPVAWRFVPIGEGAYDRNKADIEKQASDPSLTYLVREVEIGVWPHRDELPLSEAWSHIDAYEGQLWQLGASGDIRIAPHEWHIFQDGQDKTRVLARVAIIDGVTLWQSSHGKQLQEDGITAYNAHRTGPRLDDYRHKTQYLYGGPRDRALARTSQKALYLIDIEPLLDLRTVVNNP